MDSDEKFEGCICGSSDNNNLYDLFGSADAGNSCIGSVTFAEKLENCFSVKVSNKFRFICGSCVEKLEAAIVFKEQLIKGVLKYEKQDIVNDKECTVEEYNVEYLDEYMLDDESFKEETEDSEIGNPGDDINFYDVDGDDEERMIETLDDTMCIYCEEQFSSAEEVQKHIVLTHGVDPRTGEPVKVCPLCVVEISDFNDHMVRCHSEKDEDRDFRCHFCHSVYNNRKACFTHLRMKHGVKMCNSQTPIKPGPRVRVKCHLCNRDFSQKQILNKHLMKAHGFEVQKRKAFSCPLCSDRVSYGNDFSSHLLRMHGIREQVTELEFNSMDEFFKFKSAVQDETKYRFRKVSASRRTLDGIRSNYMCSQSGVYVYQGKGKRPAPERQIYKTGHACPAHMILTETLDKVLVTFYQTHVGHGPCPFYEPRELPKSKPMTISADDPNDDGDTEPKEEDDADTAQLANSLAWICDTCGMGFLQVEQFKTHVASHDPKLCPCQYCDTVFDNIEEWTHHIQQHAATNIVFEME